MKNNKVPIDNKDGLFRDLGSGAIINTNGKEYQRLKTIREQKIKEMERLSKIENEINVLKEGINKILAILNKK